MNARILYKWELFSAINVQNLDHCNLIPLSKSIVHTS